MGAKSVANNWQDFYKEIFLQNSGVQFLGYYVLRTFAKNSECNMQELVLFMSLVFCCVFGFEWVNVWSCVFAF